MIKQHRYKFMSMILAFLISGLGAGANNVSSSHEESAITAKYIEGLDVETQSGEELGLIDDLLVDVKTGEVKFYLVNTGFLGIGGELKAVPAHDLTHSFKESGKFVYQQDSESFDTLKAYDESKTTIQNMVALDKTSYPSSIEERKYGQLVLAMEALNEEVYTQDSMQIGKVENWAINTEDQSLAYVITRDLRFGTSITNPYEYHMVATDAIDRVDRHDEDIHLNVTAEEVNDAPAIGELDLIRAMEKRDTLVFRYEPVS